jgi:hypothetical protein
MDGPATGRQADALTDEGPYALAHAASAPLSGRGLRFPFSRPLSPPANSHGTLHHARGAAARACLARPPAVLTVLVPHAGGDAMRDSIAAVLPVVDLSLFLSRGATDAGDAAVQDACRQVAECLRDTGALVVRDPRVSPEDNQSFLDLMEQYFGQDHEAKLADARAELCYQVGLRAGSSGCVGLG